MVNKIAYAGSIALLCSSSVVFHTGGGVTIDSPANGSVVQAGQSFKLVFNADPGVDGDRLYLDVDGRSRTIIHQYEGSKEIGPLIPGNHKVCIGINASVHVPNGAERCIDVISE